MRTIDEVMGRCRIDDEGCWIWTGAMSKGLPKIYAPDLTVGGEMRSQLGRRAVWQMVNQRPVPEGFRVYGRCLKPACLNPECSACGFASQWGAQLSKNIKSKSTVGRQLNSRKIGRARTVLTPELIAEIQASPETGRAMARRIGVSEQTVSKARLGMITCFQPLSSPFAGLFRSLA